MILGEFLVVLDGFLVVFAGLQLVSGVDSTGSTPIASTISASRLAAS